MATQWVLGKISDALQPTVQGAVSTAGTFAGGAFNTVGNGINGVGESINGTIKRYGDGFKDYGNGVMDWTNATGSRAQTASNPLGLGSSATQGKRAVTSPSVYSAPQKSKPRSDPSKTLTATAKSTQGKIAAPPAKKAPTAQPRKAAPAPVPAKSAGVPPGANPGAFKRSTPAAAKPASSVNQGAMRKPGANTPAKTTGPVKASTASATKAKPPSSQKPNYVAAANPLGLSF